MLCWLSSPVAEATDGKLKCFVGVNVKVSGLEGPACWLSMTTKEVDCPLVCCFCLLVATGAWMTWLAGICVSVIVLMYSLAAGAGGC